MNYCSKCHGLCVELIERDPLEGVDMDVVRCLNCGHRVYQPIYAAPILVEKGKSYERGS